MLRYSTKKLKVPKCIISIPINLAVKIATIDESVWKKCVEDYFKEKKPKTHEEAWKKLEKKLAEMEAYI